MANKHSKNWLFKDAATPYFAAQLLTTVGLSIPHAILTPLLLEKGLSLSQILIIQAAFSLSVLIFEFPSGAIADIVSRRWVYIFSRLVLCVFFLVVIFGHSFPTLLIAWIVYGFASALDSGTLDAALVNNAKNRSEQEAATVHRISWLVRKENQSNFLGMMIGSTVGAILFTTIGVNIYFISFAMALLAIMSIVFFFRIPEQHSQENSNMQGLLREIKNHARLTVKEMRNSPSLKKYLLLAILVQAFMQLHMQLWQAIALEKGFPDGALIWLYLAFIAISFLGSYLPVERLFRKKILVGIGSAVFVLCALFIYAISETWYVLFYGFVVFLLIALSNYSTYGIRKSSSEERISAVASLASVCGRIGAVSTLMLASVLIQIFSPSAVLSVGFTLLAIFAVVWAGVWAGINGRKGTKSPWSRCRP